MLTAFRLEDFAFPPDGPWPDPKGMVDRLQRAGVQLVLWQIPALKAMDAPHAQHDADTAHAVAQGYVLRRQNGELYRNGAFWFHDALIPDFTQDKAADWWLNKRAYLVEQLGVAGFKTDGGEHLQGHDVVAADGRRGSELANAYPNLYVGAYHLFARRLRNGDAVTFSRAGYTGAGAFPAHWAGDENSTWEAYRRSLHAGLSSALSGVLFWGWDIGGFSEALPSAELYLRATAAAAFAPIMQYHSEYRQPGAPSKDRTPWHIQERSGDERVVPIYRFFAKLRMQLIPYLATRGLPGASPEASPSCARSSWTTGPTLSPGASSTSSASAATFWSPRSSRKAPRPARSTCRRANGRTSGPAPLPTAANGIPSPPRSTASQSTSEPAPTSA